MPAAAGERPATSGDRSAGVEVGAEGLEQTWSRRANGTESSLRIRVSVAEETGPAVGIGSGVESLAQPSWEFASDSAIRLKHEGHTQVFFYFYFLVLKKKLARISVHRWQSKISMTLKKFSMF